MRKEVRFVIGIDISVDGSLRALLGGKARALLGGKADARGISDVYSAALASPLGITLSDLLHKVG